jgi:hypothetical protein
MNWLKANAGKHIEALIIAGALVFFGRLWLQEHDARLQADAADKTAETTIASLQKQQTQVTQAAKIQVVQLQAAAQAVQTPAEAFKALPEVEPVPLHADTLPTEPERATVDVLPLYQTLNACKQDAVNLAACTTTLDLEKRITTQKDVEITALKKKPNFFHRLGKVAKVVACAGAGGAAGGYLKGGSGAAIGAAAGAGVCQLF